MTEKIAARIVKWRWYILAVAIVLTVISATTINRATINYDIAKYLDENTVTRRSLNIMEQEFGNVNQLAVMFADLPDGEAETFAEEMNAREGVMYASFMPESDEKELDGVLYRRVNLFLDVEDPTDFAADLEKEMRDRNMGEEWWIDGSAVQTLNTQKLIADEIPFALAISVVVVLVVLMISSHSYFEPIVFMLVLLMSIVINMGSNWLLPSVSFITFAVAPILQLALAMDYSIMLLHNFFELRETGLDDETALIKALARAFMPISASSLTTVAGLTALMFMSLTLGFDIGIVLAKGIVISMLCVFTVMPAFVMMFSRILSKTMHKVIPLGGRQVGHLAVLTRKMLPILLIVVILVSGYLQTQNTYKYNAPTGADATSQISVVFGYSDQIVIMFPRGESNEDYEHQRQFVRELEKIELNGKPVVNSVTGMITTGEKAIKEYTVEEISQVLGVNSIAMSFYFGSLGFGTKARGDILVDKAAEKMPENKEVRDLKAMLDFAKQMFIGNNYSRIILLIDTPQTEEDTKYVLEEMMALIERYYPDSENGIAGSTMSFYEICNAFKSDMLRVNIITIAMVFLIILLSFRSFSVPTLLVCVIQGAIWITMAVSNVKGESVFFMCYLVCLTLQMGATIDYAILTASNYIRARQMLEPKEAIVDAMTFSMPTIFTSGIILIVASFIIGRVCTVYYIYSIGRMLARGATVSVALVILLLPPLLINLDRFVIPRKKIKERN